VQVAYEYTTQAVEALIRRIYQQFDTWGTDRDHVGKNISLRVHKVEKNPVPLEESLIKPKERVVDEMAAEYDYELSDDEDGDDF
jgi:hypothetical protein